MGLRMLKRALTVLALAMMAAPAAAQTMPGMLSLDDGEPVRVTSAAAVRRALRKCGQTVGCTSVLLETCDRCILSAAADEGGYAIRTRLGPPGPEYALLGLRQRRSRSGDYLFTAAEMIEIFAGYLAGRQPAYVRSVEIPDETTQ